MKETVNVCKMFNKRNWTLELKDKEPAYLPVPNGCTCVITGIHCADITLKKVILEGIIQTIRIDKLGEESDTAQTEVRSTVIASLFPQQNPSVSVTIPFSQFNIPTVRASGGPLTLTGIYYASSDINELDD